MNIKQILKKIVFSSLFSFTFTQQNPHNDSLAFVEKPLGVTKLQRSNVHQPPQTKKNFFDPSKLRDSILHPQSAKNVLMDRQKNQSTVPNQQDAGNNTVELQNSGKNALDEKGDNVGCDSSPKKTEKDYENSKIAERNRKLAAIPDHFMKCEFYFRLFTLYIHSLLNSKITCKLYCITHII